MFPKWQRYGYSLKNATFAPRFEIKGRAKDMGTKKLYIETYGCQMNVNDTEVIFSILADEGYERTENMDQADVILANTCSVRDNAEQRIWGRIDVFRQQKKARPDVVVGIVGCMAERLKDALLDSRKVDLVAGPDAYRTLPQLLRDVAPDRPQINVLLSHEETYGDIRPVRIDKNGVSAFISIMRGCNNVCSYCVVPYTRGAERSRDPKTIVREACEVFQAGYKEVTLLGQNVDSYYWKDADDTVVDFADLLEEVALISPQLRVRYSTSHPKDISDKLIETMGRHENICRSIHLPVQSGSDAMLVKMRRRYTRAWYLERVAKIRSVMPDCAISPSCARSATMRPSCSSTPSAPGPWPPAIIRTTFRLRSRPAASTRSSRFRTNSASRATGAMSERYSGSWWKARPSAMRPNSAAGTPPARCAYSRTRNTAPGTIWMSGCCPAPRPH